MTKCGYSLLSLPFGGMGIKKNDPDEVAKKKIAQNFSREISFDITKPSKWSKEQEDQLGSSVMRMQSTMCAYRAFNCKKPSTVLHVFLENEELLSFISEQEVKNKKILDEFISQYGVDEINARKSITIAVHHKNKNYKSFLFNAIAIDTINDGWIIANVAEIKSSGTVDIKEKSLEERVFYNTIFYYLAFPECVVDGTPEETKEFKRFFGADVHIKIKQNESLIDRSGVTPHFRSGYFKTLSSEFYKNKRGQVVFVHSTFVKGKAVTVLDDGIGEMQGPSND